MNTWIEDLYAVSLELNIPAEVVQNLERLPDLLSEHLLILTRYDYFQSEVVVRSYNDLALLSVDYENYLLERTVHFTFNVEELYPRVGISIIETKKKLDAYLDKYFIQKSNRKVNHDDFCLESYPGDIEEKVKGFADFLHAQFKIRGLFWLDGTYWMQGYGLNI